MRPSRRTLLVGAAVAGGAVAVCGAGGALALRLEPPAQGAYVLSEEELRIVGAIALAMFPGAPFPLDGMQAGVPARFDAVVGDLLDDLRARGVRYVLRALEYGTLAGRGARFSELAPEEAREVLQNWTDPDFAARRMGFEAMKALMGLAYFSHPDIQARTGWQLGCKGVS